MPKFSALFQYNFSKTEEPFEMEFEADNRETAIEQAKEFALMKMLDFDPNLLKQID